MLKDSKFFKIVRYIYNYFDYYILVTVWLISSILYFFICLVAKESNSAIHEFSELLDTKINRSTIDTKVAFSTKQQFLQSFTIINDLINKEEYQAAIKVIEKIQSDMHNKLKLYRMLNIRKLLLMIYDTPDRESFSEKVSTYYKEETEIYHSLMRLHAKHHKYSLF